MSTFKQKLKTILNDTLDFYVPRPAEEKLECSILNTRKKIKKDNNKHLFRAKSSIQMNHTKNIINFLINEYKNQPKGNKQHNQMNSLLITRSKFNESSLINNKDDYFYTTIQYSIYSKGVNSKIQRDINLFKKENSLFNNKKMICNRPKSNLNNILCNFDKNNYSSFLKNQYFNSKKSNSCIKISNNDFSTIRAKNSKKGCIFEYKKKGCDKLFGKEDKNHNFYRNKDFKSYRTFTANFYQ